LFDVVLQFLTEVTFALLHGEKQGFPLGEPRCANK